MPHHVKVACEHGEIHIIVNIVMFCDVIQRNKKNEDFLVSTVLVGFQISFWRC